ncbi:caspase family protein [Arcicella rosea]|uniref:Putative caspase-like protein n=1 Tax=Arcicella rosea TaxID=502909 RepID=A0A841EX42_9BACT|nr:caspase family protein [Arcicella rosea]MBB6005653.1 putative caspase-like protein [Arcicella rosea]
MKKIITILTIILFSKSVFALSIDSLNKSSTTKRIALVIGNSSYNYFQKDITATNDVKLISKALTDLDFEVFQYLDLDYNTTKSVLAGFKEKIKNADVALLYYSGMGANVEGIDYLFPIDFKIHNNNFSESFNTNCFSNNYIFSLFEDNPNRANIILWDAGSRQDPGIHRSEKSPQIQLLPPLNTFLMYACQVGEATHATEKAISLFTEKLTTEIIINQEINFLFENVKKTVINEVKNQVPLKISTLTKKFYFTKSIDNTPPDIKITSPNLSRGFAPIEEKKQIIIKGIAKDKNGIFEVLINNEEVQLESDGSFSKTVLLAVGENTFIVKATDTRSNTSEINIKVNRQVNIDNTQRLNNIGKYYALIIGVSDYDDKNITKLDSLPIYDARNLKNILQNDYTFSNNYIITLENPTRREIIIELDNLSKRVTPDDCILIFYAGHGYFDKETEIGYWFPKDAEIDNSSNWLYNDQLISSIKKIKSKHTLLISDACFSGSIFKNRDVKITSNEPNVIRQKYELTSRKAMTSGTLTTVPNISVFMKYMLEYLQKNKDKYISASQLFKSIETPVGNNSTALPQYGVIQNTGDEGGDFIFIHK